MRKGEREKVIEKGREIEKVIEKGRREKVIEKEREMRKRDVTLEIIFVSFMTSDFIFPRGIVSVSVSACLHPQTIQEMIQENFLLVLSRIYTGDLRRCRRGKRKRFHT